MKNFCPDEHHLNEATKHTGWSVDPQNQNYSLPRTTFGMSGKRVRLLAYLRKVLGHRTGPARDQQRYHPKHVKPSQPQLSAKKFSEKNLKWKKINIDKLPQNLTEKYFHWFFSLPLVCSDPGHCKGLWEVSPQSIACEAKRPQHMTKMTCVTRFSLAYPQPLLVCLDLRCSWNSASKHFQGHRRDASRLLNVSYPQDCSRTFSTCHGPRYTIVVPWLVTATPAPNRFFPAFQFRKGLASSQARGNHWVYYLPSLHSYPLTNLQRSPATVFSDFRQSRTLRYSLHSLLSSLISQTLTLRIFSGELTTSHKQRHFRHV